MVISWEKRGPRPLSLESEENLGLKPHTRKEAMGAGSGAVWTDTPHPWSCHENTVLPDHDETVAADLRASIKSLDERMIVFENRAFEIIKEDQALFAWYESLDSIKGIARRSACLIVSELAVLPDDMTSKEVVAFAGLDPRPRESGKSTPVRRISKVGVPTLRTALFYPAVVACAHEPAVKAFYSRLVDEKHKQKKLAIVAVMRKLLTVAWVMKRTHAKFDGTLFSKAA